MKIKHIIDALMASGTIMTWLSLLVRIGGLALLLPLILAILPASDVLIWQVLSTITGLIGVVDFGLQPTFARIVAYLRSGGMIENLHNR